MRRWSRPPAPQTNWFAVATVIAVAVVVFCGGGLGGSEPVGGQTEPLTLALSAPQLCETKPARGYADSVLRQDADGNWTKRVSVFAGWFGIAEVDVSWAVSGGTETYRITIDGETRDPAHDYVGASGTASVSCAMTSGAEAFIDIAERGYKEQPEVDSGVKTIAATVTDATGATAEASVDVYVILELGSAGDRLEAGKTYRLFGEIISVPTGIELEIGALVASDFGEDEGGESVSLHVVGGSASIHLNTHDLSEAGRHIRDGDVLLYDRHDPTGRWSGLHAKLDELVASVGRAPSITGRSE